MQYLRNLQSQVSPSLWIRSHREPNKQRDFNDSNNTSSINISVISSSSNTDTSFSTPITTNSSYSSQHSNRKDNHHRHHQPGDIISVSASSGRKKLSNTEIRSLSAFHNSNSSRHNHNRVCSFKPSSNFDNNKNSSRRNSTRTSSPPPSSSTGSGFQFEPVILSLTPLKSVRREYLRRNSSISSSGSGITSLFHSANAAALLLPPSTSTDIDLSSHFHNEPRDNDKDRDECLKDINNRKRITQNLERTRNSYEENTTSSILQADHEKQSSVLLLVDDPLLHILGRRESIKIVQASSISSNKDDNLVLLPEYVHDERGKKIEKIIKTSFVENDDNITPFVVHDTTLLSPETNETTSRTGNSISNNKYINNNDIFVVASGTTTHHHQKLSSFTGIDRNISTANRISTSTPTTKNSYHHHRHHQLLLQQQRKGSLIQATVHSSADARQIHSCRESERIRRPSHSFLDEETSQTFGTPPLASPADPDFPAFAAQPEAISEKATGTSQDQRSPSCSSRISTFTRDSSRRCSTTSSTSTLFSGSDSSVSSVSDLASVILVAPNKDKQEDDNSAPVVSPTLSTLSTDSSTTVLPCDSVSSGGLFYVEGLSCSHRVNQRKKSGTHYNKNNSSSADNVINSERGRIKRKRSIIQYLLCTPPEFNLFSSPKKLLSAVFRRRKRTKLVKRRQLNSNRKRIVCLSFSPPYTCPLPEKRRPTNSKNLVRSKKRAAKRQQELLKLQNTPSCGPNKGELKLWATMDHEDLMRELPQIEKLSNQERLRLAHKRRMLQLKKFQQYEKDLNSSSKKHRGDSDLVRRNLPTAKHNNNHHNGKGRKGSRRIRFRESIMLLEAAGRNDVEGVRLLLESGVNPDVANEDGLTALHQCCIDDNEEMMKLLIDFGANVNAEDSEKWTPLHAAATCGHLHLVQYLIVRGANLLAVNAEGNMPYDICDDETTLDYIESEMAKRGVTQELIEEIRALPETKMLQDIQRVHAQGGDLEFRDPDGATPLHIASANGYYRVAEFLLDNHTATDVQDKDFWQPIHAAACWGHLDVLELLVQNGADLDARTKNNETPYAICEDPEIKERIIQLRTEQQTKRQNEGRKRPSRTHSTNSRTQSIRRTSQRDKGLTSKRDAADEAQMLRAREEHHKENSPSPTADVGGAKNSTEATTNGTATTATVVNGVPANGHPLGGDSQNNIHTNGNGTASSEEEPEITLPPHVLGRDSVGNMKMKQDEMNRLREIAVKSGAMNQNNHHNHLNNHNNHNNTNNGGVKMNNLYNNETNGSLVKNQNNFHKNLNNSASSGGGNAGNSPVTVLSSPDDNGNLLPKPEINPSVDNKVPLGSGLGLASGMPLSGSRDNLVGLSSSAGNSTIDIHVSVTINTNSPVSTLTNGGGLGTPTTTGGIHGHSNGGPHSLPLVTGNGGIFTPPGTLSDLKKQRSLIRTSSNPLTNGTLTNLIALPASASSTTNYNNDSFSSSSTFVPSFQTFKPTSNPVPSTISSSSAIIPDGQVPLSPALLLKQNNQKNTSSTIASFANCSQSSASSWHYYWNDWRNGFTYSQSQFDSSAFSSSTQASTATTTTTTTTSPSLHQKQPSLSSSSQQSNKSGGSSVFGGVPVLPTSATSPTLFPLGSYYFNSSVGGGGSSGVGTNSGVSNNNTSNSNSASSIPYNCTVAPPLSSSSVCYQNNCNGTSCATTNTNNNPFSNNQHSCYLNNLTGGINDGMTKYHPPASPTMSLRRYVGDPAETVGDYGDGGKRCCVIV